MSHTIAVSLVASRCVDDEQQQNKCSRKKLCKHPCVRVTAVDFLMYVVVCHRCCDVNPLNTSRESGAPCIEPTHLDLRTQARNLGQKTCHRRIRLFALNKANQKDPAIKTTGTIYVADTIKPESGDDYKCSHRPLCFGCFGEIKM